MKRYKVAFLISHPIQYYAPLFRLLSAHHNVDLTVYFCFKWGLETFFDSGFGQTYKWDIPLTEGYQHIFLRNYSLKPAPTFFGQVNPGIFWELATKKYDACIVHGYVSLTNWFAFLGCWLTKTPIIIKGEADLFKSIAAWKKAIKRVVLTALFKRVSAALYSYTLNKQFFRFFGIPEEKLFFYPCAVDNDFFQEKARSLKKKRGSLKKQAGIGKLRFPTILFVGKFIPRKRVSELLQAALLLQNKGTRFNLVLVGDGPQRSDLERFVKEYSLENIYFSGFKNQSELPQYYALADVFVLPSEFDPSPKALNEAMNFGLVPVVSNGVGTAPDLIEKTGSGFVYALGDVHELADHLNQVIKYRGKREKFSRNALETVKQWSFQEDISGILRALAYVNLSPKHEA